MDWWQILLVVLVVASGAYILGRRSGLRTGFKEASLRFLTNPEEMVQPMTTRTKEQEQILQEIHRIITDSISVPDVHASGQLTVLWSTTSGVDVPIRIDLEVTSAGQVYRSAHPARIPVDPERRTQALVELKNRLRGWVGEMTA